MRTYRPGPRDRATAATWRRWLLPLGATAGVGVQGFSVVTPGVAPVATSATSAGSVPAARLAVVTAATEAVNSDDARTGSPVTPIAVV